MAVASEQTDVSLSPTEQKLIVKKFKDEKEKMEKHQTAFRKNYDENDKVDFDTLEGITARANLWDMIRTHVITNPDFHAALSSTQRTSFYFRS